MQTKILLSLMLLFVFDLNAKIIYVEPVQNAKYVSINNNIIIGFDETIESRDLNSLVRVTGTVSGIHQGEIILTQDKKKLIFKPSQPFALNELVKVKLNSIKTSSGSKSNLTYTFQTQVSKPDWDHRKSLIDEFANPFYKVPDNITDTSNLPLLTVNISNNPTQGDLYLGNFPFTAVPNTPHLIIANNSGTITYSRQVDIWALDYKRQPNGLVTYYTLDKYFAEDAQHNIVDSFYCGNGYYTDHHELQVIANNHALLMSYDPQIVDMSVIVPGGNPNAIVIGLIIQEIDENKNVVFQWRSWDHILITDAIGVNLTASNIDYIHGNAIDLDHDGNLLISSRHLSEITKINRTTGEIIWRLGGLRNQFTFSNDTLGFHYQHHIRRIENGNITLFDNGNFHTPLFSRAVEYKLDEVNKTATLVWEYRNTPNIYGFAMGSAQRLHNGNTLISWGAANPTMTEVTPEGNIAFQMNLPANIFTYRTFRDEVNLTLNIKLTIEGFYDLQTNTMNMKDTVTVYARNAGSPFNIVDSARSVVDSVSLTGNFRFYNVTEGNYYISTKHRNAIETWSKREFELSEPAGVYQYDFTSSNLQAYGNNLVLKGSKYCIYSGDVNQDGTINLYDLLSVSNDANNFITGYEDTDVNGDNVVDLQDILITHSNSSKFVSVMRP